MKPRQVRDKVVEKFKAWLGYGKNISSFDHLMEHCSIHHPKMESMAQLQTYQDMAIHLN